MIDDPTTAERIAMTIVASAVVIASIMFVLSYVNPFVIHITSSIR